MGAKTGHAAATTINEKIAEAIKRRISGGDGSIALYDDMRSCMSNIILEYEGLYGSSRKNSDGWHEARRLEAYAVETSHWLKTSALNAMKAEEAKGGGGDSARILRLHDVWKKSIFFVARHSFDDFMQAVEFDKPAERKFYLPRRRYLKPIVEGYQDILDKKLRFLSISLPKRAGKALPLSAKLLTPCGYIDMGSVKAGDTLIGQDGRPTKVVGVFPQGKVDMYDVRFSDGSTVRSCGEHLWEARTQEDRGKNRSRVVSTLQIKNSRMKLCADMHNQWSVDYVKPCELGNGAQLKINPYLLGALIGDGSMLDGCAVLHNSEKDIVEMCRDALPISDVFVEAGRARSHRIKRRAKENHRCSDTMEAIRGYGLDKTHSYEKFIPDDYMWAPIGDRAQLLRGLLDTDGHVSKTCIEYSTTSQKLAEQVAWLAKSLGGKASINSRQGSYSIGGEIHPARANYRVTIMFASGGIIPVSSKKHLAKYGFKRKQLYHFIDSIEYVGKDDAQCICVDSADSLYVVGDNFIPTHNSTMGILFTLLLSGRSPERSTLMEGTGDDLVRSFYNGMLEYLEKPSDYNFYEIFPERRLVQTNADTKIFNLDKRSRFPTAMCRSIDARQVGLSEATNMLYLDDCIEGREEAKNRQRLDDKWEVISGDVIGRAIEGTPIIATGTRYSIYDPIGRLQDEARKQHWAWRAIEIPALDPITDESNYEFVDNGEKRFTTAFFREQRELLSEEQWESEFQQQPFEAKGLYFKKGDLNYFFELPVDKDPDTIIAACDTAESGSDYVAMPIAKVYGDEVYIVDVVFDDSGPQHTKPQCAKKLVDNKVVTALFESNSAGTYYARDVDKAIKEMGGHVGVKQKRSITNKETRISNASDNIIIHFYFRHESTVKRGSQYWAFMKQVCEYTRNNKNKKAHDDAPDALAMMENMVRNLEQGKVSTFRRPW